MIERSSTLVAPPARWWTPLGRDERMWLTVTAVWALAMFVMMQLVWPAIGEQQVTFQSYRVDPLEFNRLTEAFIQAHQVDAIDGVPVVAPPPGGDVYLMGQRFQFKPILRLEQGQTYRFLVSSLDVQHGLSLQPDNFNFQVLPGYVSAISLTPRESGVYHILCNEYCGPGHHRMVGRIDVGAAGQALSSEGVRP
ncbi:cytochrome C oxidase subunit II [bacterium]|nr:cytochrome c oxidase subunit II [Chloroflexi bacterium CFX6]RIL08692.1 MAG: cytochrome C oxidase subunit II [bacterium]